MSPTCRSPRRNEGALISSSSCVTTRISCVNVDAPGSVWKRTVKGSVSSSGRKPPVSTRKRSFQGDQIALLTGHRQVIGQGSRINQALRMADRSPRHVDTKGLEVRRVLETEVIVALDRPIPQQSHENACWPVSHSSPYVGTLSSSCSLAGSCPYHWRIWSKKPTRSPLERTSLPAGPMRMPAESVAIKLSSMGFSRAGGVSSSGRRIPASSSEAR